jgi:hypothetical protein
MAEQDQPKIHIDADWKAQAQAEKQRLAEQSKQAAQPSGRPGAGGAAAGAAPGAGQMPAASFETLISTMATQALFALGAIADPRTGQRYQNFDLARHHIDMLGVLEEKTRGNLSDEEQRLLASTLYELRQRYIQLVTASRSV